MTVVLRQTKTLPFVKGTAFEGWPCTITQMRCFRFCGRPRETLNSRSCAAERGLLDRAAKSSGKNRTDSILGAVHRAAEEELLDRSLFLVSPAA
jgi:hypothetical protein